MSFGISEKPSLLSSLLSKVSQEQTTTRSSAQPDSAFAGRLDAAITGEAEKRGPTSSSAQALAETLNLQMLHTTLALAGDQTADPSSPLPFNRQASAVQSLINAYRTNQAENTAPSNQPSVLSQPLPDSVDPISPITSSASVPEGSQWLEPIIARASSRFGVDASLIKAVIKAESNFNPNAVSPAGARGLMQLMPGTARGLGVSDSFDPEQNVMAGTRFLRDLLDRYQGDLDSSLAAYNWGPGNVDKHPDRLPRETRNYLTRVKQLYTSFTA
ncbi:MAG: lytic transglycosylase domain-containing protein [Desulfuromonadales bacterium]|nr:lytic transglycosylase domain-containing protein [Desulfuromonadales bacterium]